MSSEQTSEFHPNEVLFNVPMTAEDYETNPLVLEARARGKAYIHALGVQVQRQMTLKGMRPS